MEVFLVGIDHRFAPLEVRECLAVPKDDVPARLKTVHEAAEADESLLLATCNRTELYVASRFADGGERAVDALAGDLPAAPPVDSSVYRLRSGETATRHLFRVAAGLESAILGETEIQGQVKDAHEAALAAGTAGRLLDRLARGALRAGKRARAETDVSAGGVSHGSAAAQVVKRVFGTVENRKVLVVGAGQIATQTARTLAAPGGGRFVVANRTLEHGRELAASLPDARAGTLDEVEELLERAHVVVLAGAAFTLCRDAVAAALRRRRDPLLIVDLCVPRQAAPDVAELPGVFLYHLDALEELVAGALAHRRKAVSEVEAIVAEEFGEYRAWQRKLGALPAIRTVSQWAEAIRQRELSYLPETVDANIREAVEKLTRRLVQKILARPTSRVVRGMEDGDPSLPSPDQLRHLFGLEGAGADDEPGKPRKES